MQGTRLRSSASPPSSMLKESPPCPLCSLLPCVLPGPCPPQRRAAHLPGVEASGGSGALSL